MVALLLLTRVTLTKEFWKEERLNLNKFREVGLPAKIEAARRLKPRLPAKGMLRSRRTLQANKSDSRLQ